MKTLTFLGVYFAFTIGFAFAQVASTVKDESAGLIGVLTLVGTPFVAASECPDPKLRQADIGGDTVDGVVLKKGRPVTSVLVRLYFSSGKTAWVGETDKNGKFIIKKLPPDIYSIDVQGWGKAKITLNPELDKGVQKGVWFVGLSDNTCIAWTFVTN